MINNHTDLLAYAGTFRVIIEDSAGTLLYNIDVLNDASYWSFAGGVATYNVTIAGYSPEIDHKVKILGTCNPIKGALSDEVYIMTDVVLDADVSEFSGERIGIMAYLWWKTQSEINNSHFEILISSDGKEYSYLGEVQGFGNSTSIREYSFEARLQEGDNYFKLRQVDEDGTKHNLNKIVHLKYESREKVNFAGNNVIFDHNVIQEVYIVDLQGKLVKTLESSQEIDYLDGIHIIIWKINEKISSKKTYFTRRGA